MDGHNKKMLTKVTQFSIKKCTEFMSVMLKNIFTNFFVSMKFEVANTSEGQNNSKYISI